MASCTAETRTILEKQCFSRLQGVHFPRVTLDVIAKKPVSPKYDSRSFSVSGKCSCCDALIFSSGVLKPRARGHQLFVPDIEWPGTLNRFCADSYKC